MKGPLEQARSLKFTDDDLARLKLNSYAPRKTVNALIARMEAADILIEHMRAYIPLCVLSDCATYNAYLKLAGK